MYMRCDKMANAISKDGKFIDLGDVRSAGYIKLKNTGSVYVIKCSSGEIVLNKTDMRHMRNV